MKASVLYLIVAAVFVVLLVLLSNTDIFKPVYFDDNAKVMYFYSDACHVCNLIKPALQSLGDRGYRIKPINVLTNQKLDQQYAITGTPTFITPDNARLEGMLKDETVEQFESRLQLFLDKYK